MSAPVKVFRIGGTATPEAESFDEAITRYPDERLLSGRKSARSDIAAYFHTGGTTGDPKLAQHTHGGQVFQAWMGLVLGAQDDDVVLVGLPLFHVAAAYCWGIAVLARGATLALLGPLGFRTTGVISNLWKLIERLRATRVGIVPTIALALLEVPKAGCDISTVRRYGCGAAPLSPEVARAFSAYVGLPLLEGYGLTEASGITHCIILEQMPVTAVGKIFKPALRQDATKRAIQAALSPLVANGLAIDVQVIPDERYGMLTRVTVRAAASGASDDLRHRIDALLARFSGHREVVIQ